MTSVSQTADPRRFPTLSDEHMEAFEKIGETLELADGTEFVSEEHAQDGFYVIRHGRVQVSKKTVGSASILRVHEESEFIGELSALSGENSPFTARALGPATVIRLSIDQLRLVLARCPELASKVIPAMARRVHDVESMLQERDKLAALGKLAAGLTHELNNPVSAGMRAVSGVRNRLDALSDHAISLGSGCFTPEEIAEIRAQLTRASKALDSDLDLDPLALSDREESIAEWLSGRGCKDAWDWAPVLTKGGYTPESLEELAGRIPADSMERVMDFVGSRLAVESMLRDAERSLTRISDIVRAVKSYSRMDAAPVAEADLNEGLEDTLKMLAYPLRPFKVVREFEGGIPTICAYATELNQVWTNLVDNAIAAMGESGTLTLRTARSGPDHVIVEISDTGPGIPAEVQPRIFEAFFTTKPVGEGTGLGLDIVQRIVTVRHNGEISFETGPSGTTFLVRLPILQPSL